MAEVGLKDGNERFNAEAAAWDSNPFVRAMSLLAGEALHKFLPSILANKPDILEIGCGTGLLSVVVAPDAKRLVAVDAAEGMIQVLSSKLSKPDVPKNIIPLAILLEDPEDKRLPPVDDTKPDGPRLKYDLIISHLVLHHIADVKSTLKTMLGCLKEGGLVALTDFEDFGPEAKRFHPESKMPGVERHGIPKKWIADLMREVGFKDVRIEVAWEHASQVERYPGEFGNSNPVKGQGELMTFPYLICIGKRG